MARVLAISMNTFREAVRSKVLYTLVFFAFLIMLAATLLDRVTLGVQSKLIKDLGLGGINFFGVLIAIFIGIGLVYKELERRTIYTLVSKPIHRYQFLIGKYLGILQTLLVQVAIMSALLYALLAVFGTGKDWHLLVAIGLIYQELMVVSAVAIFFSSFSTPILSGMFTLAVYVIGHLTGDLKAFGAISDDPGIRKATAFFYYFLPNLENFNIKGEMVYGLPVSSTRIGFSLMYGFVYIALLLLSSAIVFQGRDFK
jgi:ABC-type transport system involved in multi-copper enzyme maturation permease subunit